LGRAGLATTPCPPPLIPLLALRADFFTHPAFDTTRRLRPISPVGHPTLVTPWHFDYVCPTHQEGVSSASVDGFLPRTDSGFDIFSQLTGRPVTFVLLPKAPLPGRRLLFRISLSRMVWSGHFGRAFFWCFCWDRNKHPGCTRRSRGFLALLPPRGPRLVVRFLVCGHPRSAPTL